MNNAPPRTYRHVSCMALIAAVILALAGPGQALADHVNVFFVGGQSNANDQLSHGVASALAASGRYGNFQIVHINHSGNQLWQWIQAPGGVPTPQANYQADFFNSTQTGALEQAFADIRHNGDTPVLRGFFWFQGEGDTGSATNVNLYRQRFLAMMELLRQDVQQNDPIRFALAIIDAKVDTLDADRQQLTDQLRAIQLQIGADFEHGVAVDSRPFARSDAWHLVYPTGSYNFGVELGEAFIANDIPEPISFAILTPLVMWGVFRRDRRCDTRTCASRGNRS